MFGTWATASDTDVADALRAARGNRVEFPATRPTEAFTGEELYEAHSHPAEQHEHHHTNA